MSAEVLREAARLMRDRAEAATPGPWVKDEIHGRDFTDEGWSEVSVAHHPIAGSKATEALALTSAMGWEGVDEAGENAAHIASWHPAVALAVAHWLDDCAQYLEDEPDYTHDGEDYALAVARAYLGDPS